MRATLRHSCTELILTDPQWSNIALRLFVSTWGELTTPQLVRELSVKWVYNRLYKQCS
ncbi:uncharacterized protein PHALS_11001 [Plasmopara halstedii]|uniref:Uncharacterized protein n=1 Tax=Plasmopara halstedii TaxID=4781 RepID=A0A0P1AIY0_PLAHL|nr:uncharacterized protein PHALS_11001 [Plasmopara halstedii]CEG40821.1 hypothetical protein PHALS_11001 [Plasmopara halstedii]|eukprot:XP_024577190.1 hypothetical protein PHALS_11001 [Plasmopara halstedii]